jgi:hypothetical protein
MMVSVRHFVQDSLLATGLFVAVVVGVSIPASHLIGVSLDRYSPLLHRGWPSPYLIKMAGSWTARANTSFTTLSRIRAYPIGQWSYTRPLTRR